MRFFPLTIIAVVALVAIQWKHATPSTNRIRRWIAISALILAAAAYLYSVFSFSPWLSHAALILAFTAWALGRWGNYHWAAIVGWACVLATTLPLPWGWDESFQAWLQGFAVWGTTCSLDALEIACLRNGNLLEIRGLSLFADEVCDIWAGPYALFSFAAILMAFQHRGIVVCAKVLGLIPVWVVMINYLRMLSITLLFEYHSINAASGRDFGLLVIGTTLLAIFLIWLSSMFFRQMFMPIPVADAEFGPIFSGLNKLFFWPLKDPLEDIPPDDPDDRKMFEKRKAQIAEQQAAMPKFDWLTTPASLWCVRAASACLVVGGGIAVAALAGGKLGELNFGAPTIAAETISSIATADSMPQQLDGGWQQVDFAQIQRSSRSRSGAHGLRWTYMSGNQRFTAGIDLPFIGLHNPVTNLARRGWTIVKERFGQKQGWPYAEAELENELGGKAYLYFSLFTADGKPYVRPLSSQEIASQEVADEANSGEGESGANTVTQLFELFVESGEELSETQLAPFREHFLQLRSAATKVTPASASATSAN